MLYNHQTFSRSLWHNTSHECKEEMDEDKYHGQARGRSGIILLFHEKDFLTLSEINSCFMLPVYIL